MPANTALADFADISARMGNHGPAYVGTARSWSLTTLMLALHEEVSTDLTWQDAADLSKDTKAKRPL